MQLKTDEVSKNYERVKMIRLLIRSENCTSLLSYSIAKEVSCVLILMLLFIALTCIYLSIVINT